MKLIVGFGNPGSQYNFTRHNLGFLALDFYFKKKGLSWESSEKNSSIWAKSGDVIFIKPQTFYNDSGLAVASFSRYYKIPVSDILVICDDFMMEFGKTRLRLAGRAAGNNGLKSVIAALGTEDSPRIRVGIENSALRKKIGDTDFVLGKFLPEEKELLPGVLAEVEQKLDQFLENK